MPHVPSCSWTTCCWSDGFTLLEKPTVKVVLHVVRTQNSLAFMSCLAYVGRTRHYVYQQFLAAGNRIGRLRLQHKALGAAINIADESCLSSTTVTMKPSHHANVHELKPWP